MNILAKLSYSNRLEKNKNDAVSVWERKNNGEKHF